MFRIILKQPFNVSCKEKRLTSISVILITSSGDIMLVNKRFYIKLFNLLRYVAAELWLNDNDVAVCRRKGARLVHHGRIWISGSALFPADLLYGSSLLLSATDRLLGAVATARPGEWRYANANTKTSTKSDQRHKIRIVLHLNFLFYFSINVMTDTKHRHPEYTP